MNVIGTLRALIYGESGIGKSRLMATMPAPRLILDAEGRAHYLPVKPYIFWNPRTEECPRYDGTWQTVIVQVTDFEVVALVWQWLRSGKHDFVSVGLDSVMEIQKRCIDNLKPGTGSLEWDDYNVLKREVEKKVREYRDLTQIEACKVKVVLFICGSQVNESSKKTEPLLAGGFRKEIPFYMDVVGYLHHQATPTGNVRALLIDKTPLFEAKDGTDALKLHYGPVIMLPEEAPPRQWVAEFQTVLSQHALADATAEGGSA